jgi:hypothetical protein
MAENVRVLATGQLLFGTSVRWTMIAALLGFPKHGIGSSSQAWRRRSIAITERAHAILEVGTI